MRLASKDYIDGLPFTVAHDDFDRYNMHVLAAPTCNYYERGTISPPPYVYHTIELQEAAYTMHWPLLGVHELFFYDIRCIGRELDFVIML